MIAVLTALLTMSRATAQRIRRNQLLSDVSGIRQSTLGNDQPQLKDSNTGDMIHFYGPCDENLMSINGQAKMGWR